MNGFIHIWRKLSPKWRLRVIFHPVFGGIYFFLVTMPLILPFEAGQWSSIFSGILMQVAFALMIVELLIYWALRPSSGTPRRHQPHRRAF